MKKPWLKRFMVCSVVMGVCLLADCGLDLSYFSKSGSIETVTDIIYYIQLVLNYGLYIRLFFILSLVPFTVGFCEERQDGMYPYIVSRWGYGKYTFYTYCRGVLGAGFTAATGFLFFIAFLHFIGVPLYNNEAVNAIAWQTGVFGEYLLTGQYCKYLLSITACVSMGYMFWAGFVLCFSIFYSQIQVVLVSGLILDYLSAMIAEFVSVPSNLQFHSLFFAQSNFGNTWANLLVPLSVTAIGVLCTGIYFYWRLKKERGG